MHEITVVDVLAVKDWYIQVRKEIEPTFKGYIAADQEEYFQKAAVVMKKLNARPEDYVRAQAIGCRTDLFFINQLATRSAPENYNTYMRGIVGEPDKILENQMAYWDFQVNKLLRDPKKVLLDEKVDFYPWFRILIDPEDFPEVREKYYEAAKQSLHPIMLDYLKTQPGLHLERLNGKDPV